MTPWKPLNRESAFRLFAEYSIMVEGYDVFPLDTAVKLFGNEIVSRAIDYTRGKKLLPYNSYFSRGRHLDYICKECFLVCVTYKNIETLGVSDTILVFSVLSNKDAG